MNDHEKRMYNTGLDLCQMHNIYEKASSYKEYKIGSLVEVEFFHTIGPLYGAITEIAMFGSVLGFIKLKIAGESNEMRVYDHNMLSLSPWNINE